MIGGALSPSPIVRTGTRRVTRPEAWRVVVPVVVPRVAPRGWPAISPQISLRVSLRVSLSVVLAGLLPGGAARADDAPTSPFVIEQPARAFGRVIGDVLVQRVVADERAVLVATADTLPAGRVDAWFERLPPRVLERRSGGHALELRYRLVNAPIEPDIVRLPPLSLESGDGATLEVPEWPVGIGPLTPREAIGEGDLLALRPDRRLPPFDTSGDEHRLLGTGLALAVIVLAWLGWWAWRWRSDRVRSPFARALRAMREVPEAGRDESDEAWTALHRALDDTAGGTVHRGSLERLLEVAPWLAPSREAIERFYAASAARYFSQPARAEPFPVVELGRALYRAERRNARR